MKREEKGDHQSLQTSKAVMSETVEGDYLTEC